MEWYEEIQIFDRVATGFLEILFSSSDFFKHFEVLCLFFSWKIK